MVNCEPYAQFNYPQVGSDTPTPNPFLPTTDASTRTMRTSSVSEKVWAQAIHAVTVQKMSLRRAAQLYGVHHMSLHRRVRGRYMSSQPVRSNDTFRLTAVEEEEIVSVLREQYQHEHYVSSDDVRFVVRTIASHDGERILPSDFPMNGWIQNFKYVHGFASDSPRSTHQEAQPMKSPRRELPPINPPINPTYNVSITPTAYGSEERDSTSESESEHHRESRERNQDVNMSSQKTFRQSSTVAPETWDKAMDAVEIHGMSLRNAAKAFGVHFAALHRRLKKRALKKEQSPPLENYIPFEDEAGILRVIHARADLGILMTFEELVDVLDRTAMKTMTMSPELSRSVVRRFQSRVEQSIRHLITEWPLPHIGAIYRYQGEDANPPPLAPQVPILQPRSSIVASSQELKLNFSQLSCEPIRGFVSQVDHRTPLFRERGLRNGNEQPQDGSFSSILRL